MDIREKRLQEFIITQLFPINIIEENSLKRLSISLNFYKICKNFPKDQIGKMKKLQKEFEKDNVSKLLFNKEFKELDSNEIILSKKIMNKRSNSSIRTSNYAKFLIRSILKTYDEKIKISSFKEEVYENWIFEKDGIKMDITLNKDKLFKDNCIYLDPNIIFDTNQILNKNFALEFFNKFLNITNDQKVIEINNCLNKIIDNHYILYSLEEEKEESLIKRNFL